MHGHFKVFALLLSAVVVMAGLSYAHWPEDRLPPNTQADKILIEKSKRTLTIFQKGQPLKSYHVALGRQPQGPKQVEGDKKTPEGNYQIDRKNPDSAFHLALHISYPNPSDVQKAKELGAAPGGDILIHGIRNGLGWIGKFQRLFDWTVGCIAVTNPEIEELWRVVPVGTPVEIDP